MKRTLTLGCALVAGFACAGPPLPPTAILPELVPTLAYLVRSPAPLVIVPPPRTNQITVKAWVNGNGILGLKWALETQSNLLATNWTRIATAPSPFGGSWLSFTVPATNGQAYFRFRSFF